MKKSFLVFAMLGFALLSQQTIYANDEEMKTDEVITDEKQEESIVDEEATSAVQPKEELLDNLNEVDKNETIEDLDISAHQYPHLPPVYLNGADYKIDPAVTPDPIILKELRRYDLNGDGILSEAEYDEIGHFYVDTYFGDGSIPDYTGLETVPAKIFMIEGADGLDKITLENWNRPDAWIVLARLNDCEEVYLRNMNVYSVGVKFSDKVKKVEADNITLYGDNSFAAEYVDNLETLTVRNLKGGVAAQVAPKLTSFDVSQGNEGVSGVTLYGCDKLENFNFKDVPNIWYIFMYGQTPLLKDIDITTNKKLEILHLDGEEKTVYLSPGMNELMNFEPLDPIFRMPNLVMNLEGYYSVAEDGTKYVNMSEVLPTKVLEVFELRTYQNYNPQTKILSIPSSESETILQAGNPSSGLPTTWKFITKKTGVLPEQIDPSKPSIESNNQQKPVATGDASHVYSYMILAGISLCIFIKLQRYKSLNNR